MDRLERLSERNYPAAWPEDRDAILREALADADAARRRRACELAALDFDRTFVRDVIELVCGDPTPDVRCAAARQLEALLLEVDGTRDEIDTLLQDITSEALRSVWEDRSQPDVVRQCALVAGARAHRPWTVEPTRWALSHPDADWRVAGIRSARVHARVFDDRIVAMLEDASRAVRLAACEAVGYAALARGGPRVAAWALSKDADPEIRLEAIAALRAIPGTGCVEALHVLLDSADADIAASALQSLEERTGLVDEAEA